MRREHPRELIWIGDSLDILREFPKQVQKDIGDTLNDVQHGETPPSAKPFKGIGPGVFEIVTRFDTNTFRTIYAVKIKERVYVLHAFQKKSPHGVKTAKSDIELIKTRYKKAIEIAKEENNDSDG